MSLDLMSQMKTSGGFQMTEKCENCNGTGSCEVLHQICSEAFPLICVVCRGEGEVECGDS
jgi:DnaJ-class molecular chaperone